MEDETFQVDEVIDAEWRASVSNFLMWQESGWYFSAQWSESQLVPDGVVAYVSLYIARRMTKRLFTGKQKFLPHIAVVRKPTSTDQESRLHSWNCIQRHPVFSRSDSTTGGSHHYL
jgi:hypothetical protein